MEGSITHFLAFIHTLYIIITTCKFIAIASSCQLSNLSSLVHSSLLSSKKINVNSIEFLVLFYTTFPKDFGEAKQNCQKNCQKNELFNLAKARDFPESASVFQ